MTREIGTCPAYELPQAWAAAFSATGRHTGIRYQTRFSTGAGANAVALFEDAGHHDWAVDPSPTGGVQACVTVGIVVAHRPVRRQVRIQPPRLGRRVSASGL